MAGSPKSSALISPSAITTQTDAATDVVLEVKNGLGVSIPPGAKCCGGALVRFEVARCPVNLGIDFHKLKAPWSYSVVFKEPVGSKIKDDVLAQLEAALVINERDVLRAAPIDVHFIPAEKLKHQSESQRHELQALQGKKTELENRNREAEAQVRKKANLRQSLEAAKTALRALCPRSAVERNIEANEQALGDMRQTRSFLPSVPDLTLRTSANGGGALIAFLQDRQHGRLDSRIANSVVGVVGEMGYAKDDWAANAIAAVAGENLQAVVVRTERDLDILWNIPRYKGLKIIAIGSLRSCPSLNRQGLLDFSRESAR